MELNHVVGKELVWTQIHLSVLFSTFSGMFDATELKSKLPYTIRR